MGALSKKRYIFFLCLYLFNKLIKNFLNVIAVCFLVVATCTVPSKGATAPIMWIPFFPPGLGISGCSPFFHQRRVVVGAHLTLHSSPNRMTSSGSRVSTFFLILAWTILVSRDCPVPARFLAWAIRGRVDGDSTGLLERRSWCWTWFSRGMRRFYHPSQKNHSQGHVGFLECHHEVYLAVPSWDEALHRAVTSFLSLLSPGRWTHEPNSRGFDATCAGCVRLSWRFLLRASGSLPRFVSSFGRPFPCRKVRAIRQGRARCAWSEAFSHYKNASRQI